jgi:hypothetical protein
VASDRYDMSPGRVAKGGTGLRHVRASVPAGEFTPSLITVPNIEVLEVGEDWETSTGLFTWTEEDLLSAISSQEDPAIRTPVVKLGHVDPRFDGQPAFGRMGNLRLSVNQQTLIADLIGVPQWLAHIMPSAYPRRSIEGWFGFQSKTGNEWPFVLTAIALLGDAYPAIVTLDDLKILWGGVAPPLYPVDDIEEMEDNYVAASRPNGLIAARRVVTVPNWLHRKNDQAREVSAAANGGGQVQATTSMTDVQREWYESLEGPMNWWWIRSILVNPFQLVVDDDEGGLYLVDVTVSASDEITFGEPQSVKVEYVAAVNSNLANVRKSGQIAAASYGDRVAAGAQPREEGTEEGTQGAPPDSTEREQDIVLTDAALRALGLEPGATEEQINTAILANLQGNGDGNGEGDGNGTTTTEPATPGTAVPPNTAPAAPTTAPTTTTPGEGDGDGGGNTTEQTTGQVTIPEGMTLVDSAAWEEVRGEVAASRSDRTRRAEQERDQFIAACVQTGKFPKARIDHYKNLWSLDPQGTKAALSALPDGLIPVTERGTTGETEVAVEAAYPESWKRDPHVVRARNSVSTRVKVAND